MITDVRRRLFVALEALSEDQPEVRFGQLISNLSYLTREPSNEAIWDAEDEELLVASRQILANRDHSVPAEAK